jgi:uncharacterized membrane protein YgcG
VHYKIFILTMSIALLLVSCKSIQLESRWLDRPLAFDGKASEWNDLILYPKDTKFGIGVMNDDKYLYLCMTSWDSKVSAQIMRMGFTAWFETKSNRLGIHYPMGMTKSGLRHETDQGPEIMKEKITESLEHIEILGPGKDDTCPTRTVISESMGIITRIVSTEGNCIYELKVPLISDSIRKFAINILKNDIIKLKLETSTNEPGRTNIEAGESSSGEGMSGHAASGGMGGGMHAGGGHGGGSRGGHGAGAGINTLEPFKQSFEIKLSSKQIAIK